MKNHFKIFPPPLLLRSPEGRAGGGASFLASYSLISGPSDCFFGLKGAAVGGTYPSFLGGSVFATGATGAGVGGTTDDLPGAAEGINTSPVGAGVGGILFGIGFWFSAMERKNKEEKRKEERGKKNDGLTPLYPP